MLDPRNMSHDSLTTGDYGEAPSFRSRHYRPSFPQPGAAVTGLLEELNGREKSVFTRYTCTANWLGWTLG